MNERIKELWEECKTINWSYDNQTYDHEKFAELIVRECVSIAFDESAQAGRMNKPGNCLFGTNIGSRIEKHFGVEE
jgi:hypothetical protein